MSKSQIRFPKKTIADTMMRKVVAEQNKRLIAYAEEELFEMIVTREFTSRTYNLIDSYVWAVFYDGKEQGHGFVGGKKAVENAYLHAFSKTNRIPVDGRAEAQSFINAARTMYANRDGWVIVWAACAPYAYYLDPAAGNSPTNRFLVISQRYDHIVGALGPKTKVQFIKNAPA